MTNKSHFISDKQVINETQNVNNWYDGKIINFNEKKLEPRWIVICKSNLHLR